jgi:hypothetical protein
MNTLGTEDFTVEIFIKIPEETRVDGGLSEIALVRKSVTTSLHSEETIDGVLFFAVSVFDADHRLMSKQLTRADLVTA